MRKVYSMFLRACLCVSLPVAMFSCSDSDDDPVTIPTNPNAVLAGKWSKVASMEGNWVVSPDGDTKVLRIEHFFLVGSNVFYRDSSWVVCEDAFTLDYNPQAQTLTISTDTTAKQMDIVSMEENRIVYADPTTEDTIKLKKTGEFCSVAPDSIDGFYMSAHRFKLHGMMFGLKGYARQFFYYDEVVDELISDYTYTPGEGNKGHLSYHVKYRINPMKLSAFLGKKVTTDVTFDIKGELDLEFLAHEAGSKYSDEVYLGVMDGKVESTSVNNVKGTVNSAVVTGRRYFALTKAEE